MPGYFFVSCVLRAPFSASQRQPCPPIPSRTTGQPHVEILYNFKEIFLPPTVLILSSP